MTHCFVKYMDNQLSLSVKQKATESKQDQRNSNIRTDTEVCFKNMELI
jgi:hypothetical protein